MDDKDRTEAGKSFMTTPLSERGVPVFFVYIMAVLGAIYILNPGAGVIEIIPDNIPVIGNLDEGGAFLALWYGLLEFFEGRKTREGKGTSQE